MGVGFPDLFKTGFPFCPWPLARDMSITYDHPHGSMLLYSTYMECVGTTNNKARNNKTHPCVGVDSHLGFSRSGWLSAFKESYEQATCGLWGTHIFNHGPPVKWVSCWPVPSRFIWCLEIAHPKTWCFQEPTSHPFFGWEGSPTKIDKTGKTSWYPCSILSTGGPRLNTTDTPILFTTHQSRPRRSRACNPVVCVRTTAAYLPFAEMNMFLFSPVDVNLYLSLQTHVFFSTDLSRFKICFFAFGGILALLPLSSSLRLAPSDYCPGGSRYDFPQKDLR